MGFHLSGLFHPIGLKLVLRAFNATLNNIFQLYCGCQFYWRGKPNYTEKTTDSIQINDKLNHKVVSRPPRHGQQSNTQP